MEFPATLEQQLTHLTHDLKQSGDDQGAVFKALVDDLTTAIPSFLGLTVTWPTLAGPVTLTTMDRAGVDAAGTSLLLPLDLLSDTATNGSSVTFFAKNPGAFVDLASDTQFAYRLDGDIALDQHLRADKPDNQPAGPSLDELSQINQAIGVLIDQGHHPDQAGPELQHRAGDASHTLHQAAGYLLGTLL